MKIKALQINITVIEIEACKNVFVEHGTYIRSALEPRPAYAYICMYIYMHVYIYVCMYIHMHIYLYMYVCIYIYLNTHE